MEDKSFTPYPQHKSKNDDTDANLTTLSGQVIGKRRAHPVPVRTQPASKGYKIPTA